MIKGDTCPDGRQHIFVTQTFPVVLTWLFLALLLSAFTCSLSPVSKHCSEHSEAVLEELLN